MAWGIESNYNPMIAVKAGADMAQGMFNAERKARQYNALREMFGNAVGPDDTLAQLDLNRRANELQPGALEKQALDNASTRQTNAFNEVMNPLKIQEKQDTNAYNAQTLPSRVAVQNQQPTLNDQKIQAGRQKIAENEATLGDNRAERERTAAQGIIAAVKERVERGEDPAQAFDSVAGHVAAMENVDPGQLRSLRESFVRDPKGTISAMENYIGAARPNTALMQAQASQTRAAASQVAADAKAKKLNPETQAADVASLESENATVGRAFDSLIGTPDRPGTVDSLSSSTPTRAFHEWIAGKNNGITLSGAENAFRADLNTIVSTLGLDKLQAIRAKGVSLGQVTEGEHKLLQASVTRLKGMTDPEEIRREMIVLKHHYDRYQSALMSDLKKRPGGAAALATVEGLDKPAAAAAPEDEAVRRKALLDKYR